MFTFLQSSLSQPFVTQRRPGRLKLLYKQDRPSAWGGVGSIPGRPHRILLHSSWRPSHSALVWSLGGQRAQRVGCYLLLPGFSRFPLQPMGSLWAAEMGRAETCGSTFWVSAWAQSRNLRRVCRWKRSCELGWLCPTVSLPAFIKELVALLPTCVGLLEASAWVSLGPATPHMPHCIHPACGSTCTERVPQRWTLEAAQSWEAGPGAQRAPHSQKQVLSGSRPVDLRGSQSPASLPAPPGPAGAPPLHKQGDPGLCPPWPTRCLLCPRRWRPTRCRRRTFARACLSGKRPVWAVPIPAGTCLTLLASVGDQGTKRVCAPGAGGSRAGRRTQGPGVHLIQLPQYCSATHCQFWNKLQLSPQISSLWTNFFL